MMTHICKFLILACSLFSITAATDLEKYFNFNGRLTDAKGVSLAGTLEVSMEARLYNVASEGVVKYSQFFPNVKTSNGLFRLLIGPVTDLGENLDFEDCRYLELVVNGEPLSPRSFLSNVAHSITAQDSKRFEGYTTSTFVTFVSDYLKDNPFMGKGTTSEFLRGDHTWHQINSQTVGLDNVINAVQLQQDQNLSTCFD